MQVGEKTVVSLRYCMKNSNGDVLQDILDSAPVEYLHGGGGIMPALEECLYGLHAGDKKKVAISNQMDAQLDSQFYFDVVIDAVRPATDEEIAKGKPVKANIAEVCGPDCACWQGIE